MNKITISTSINRNINDVWDHFTNPEHITKWNFASDDWCCPSASNDLRPGGKLTSRMEAKDGSMGFDFGGTYTNIKTNELLEYVLEDGREVTVSFKGNNGKVDILETFDPEGENDPEFQRQGWQAILNNFKKYSESA
ncbi:MAG: SRPBCC family protein [Bacteroidota bacterium]